jgi:hypothetical protein
MVSVANDHAVYHLIVRALPAAQVAAAGQL